MDATDMAWKTGKIKLDARESWRELTKEEINLVIAQDGSRDCGSSQDILDQMHIAIGDVNKVSPLRIRVWISGRDGISGTGDDLIIPWGENSGR